jgi:hypothetical protein
MKRLALAAALLIASLAAALAQSNVQVIGPVTPGDCTAFSSPTIVKDGGFPCPGSGGTLNLPNGTTATTQSPSTDSTTKVATDQFVQSAIAGGGNLPLTNAQIYVGNASNIANGVTPSGAGDCGFTLANTGVETFTCTKTNGTPFAPSATTDTTNASNIASGTLNTARLPAPFTNGTIAGNTSKFGTVAGTLTSGHCTSIDANGNFIDAGTACSGAGVTSLAGRTGALTCESTTGCYIMVTDPPFNAACNGSTDDSVAIQAAINSFPSTGGTLLIPQGVICSYATTLVGKSFVKIKGYGIRTTGASGASVLKYTGTSTCLNLRDLNGFSLEGLYITYSNASTLTNFCIDATTATPGTAVSQNFSMIDDVVAPFPGAAATTICLNIGNTILVRIERVNFLGCGGGISGFRLATAIQSTVVHIVDSEFINYQQSIGAILGCGEAWVIENSTFEQSSTGQGNAFSMGGASVCNGMSWVGNWFGDMTVNGGTWITVTASGFTFTGNRISGIQSSSIAVAATGGGGYDFRGNSITNFSTALSCTGSAVGFQTATNGFASNTSNLSIGTCTP